MSSNKLKDKFLEYLTPRFQYNEIFTYTVSDVSKHYDGIKFELELKQHPGWAITYIFDYYMFASIPESEYERVFDHTISDLMNSLINKYNN